MFARIGRRVQTLLLFIAAMLCWQGAAHATVALSGQFLPDQIFQGERSRLVITIQNDQAAILNAATFTNNLPTQLRLYTGPGLVAPSTTCTAGTVSGSAGTGPGGADQVLLTGGQIPAAPVNGQVTCQIAIDVTSLVSLGAGNSTTYNNTLDPAAYSDSINASAAPGVITASILVRGLTPPSVAKTFGTSPLPQGNNSTVTITLTNSNTTADMPLTTFVDNLPGNLTVAAAPVPATTCTGGTVSNTASSITLTGGTIAANASCTVTFSVTGVLPALTSTQAGTNSFAAGAVGNTRGLTSGAASTNITVNSPIRLAKGFGTSPLAVGNNSLLTVRISNDSPASLTNVGLADIVGSGWPSQITNSAAISAANLAGCGPGTLTAGAGGAFGSGFTLAGATILAGAECVITFNVTSSTPSGGASDWTNSIPAGAVTSTQGFYSPARTARLDVRDDSLTVAKSVSPTSVAPGDIVTFTVNLTTFSPTPQTGVTFTDNLPGGMLFVDNSVTGGILPVLTGAGCTNLVRAGTNASPQFTLDMPVAVAGGSMCTVRFTARAPITATPGVTTFINSTGPVGNGPGGVSGNTAAAGSLSVLQPFTVSKTFDGVALRTLPQGSATQVEIILTNNNASALTNVTFTDTLPTTPGQIRVANPANATSTCGGVLTAAPGDTAITLTGGTIARRAAATPFAAGTCAIRVNVVGGTVGAPTAHTNSIPVNAVSATGEINGVPGATVRNTNAASAQLQYTAALRATKSFLTNPVTAGGTSRVRIVLLNEGAGVLTGVSVIDPLSTDLLIANPANASSTCNGPIAITANPGNNPATLTGATLPAGSVATPSTCEFLFDVVSPSGATAVNTIPVNNITADGGVSNSTTVTASLTKTTAAVLLTKSFNPTTISSPGQVSQLRINIENSAAITLTNVGITDNMPAGMQVAVVPNASTTCAGGIVNATAGAGNVSLSNATMAAGAICQVLVDVTTLQVGTLTNTLPVGAITNTQGISNTNPFSANLSALAALGIAKNFTPPSVPPNTRSRLALVLNNTLAIPLTAISGTDNLPAGLNIATPANVTTTCTGATVTTNANSITFSGASLPANNGSCRIEVDVIAPAVGAYENVIPGGTLVANGGNVTNPPPGTRATLNVLLPPTIAKAFTAAVVNPGQANRLTVTITNPNAGQALTNVALRDTLPTGLFVAPTPNASTTCAGGAVSAVPSATSAQVAGATIPAAGACTFQFDTVSNIAGLYTNTIAANSLTSSQGVTNTNPATDQVRVLTPPTLSKSFSPTSISPGANSRLTITLGNQNTTAQTLAQALVDNLPINVTVAGTPNATTTCTGATITAVAAATSVTVSNGTQIPAGGCVVQVNVTSNTAGTYNNNIPASALRTNVGSNVDPATAPLIVSPLGAISGLVYRDDNNNGTRQIAEPIFAGQTIELLNAGNAVIATTTTDVNGAYLFTGLAAGTYSVRQVAQPAGTLPGRTTQGTITGAGGGTAGTPSTVAVTPSTITAIILGTDGTNVSSSADNNFGEIVASEISGTVYRDDDNSGTINGSEPGLGGVTVTLSGTDDLGQAVLLTTTTAADGTYSFTGLRPSTAYTLTEGAQPAGTANGITSAGTVRDKTTSSTVGAAGAGSNNAPAAPPAPAGTSRIANINLPPNAVSPNNNFGELASTRTISGRIHTDNNADGSANGADAGVGTGAAGANNVAQSLTLTGTDVNGNAVNLVTTTDATGNYNFINLPPSNGAGYTVTCTTCTPPAGFINSPGPLAYPGSTGGAAGGTQAVPLISGINLAGTNTISANNNFTKIPNGPLLSGRVLFDANDNGTFDSPADFGIANQTVELRDNGTNALVLTTTTDANGFYTFTGIVPGTYRVVQPNQPAGTTDGKTAAGTVNGAAQGTPTAQGVVPSMITGITITAGQSGANYNFPETASVTIGGRVYEDVDVSGTFNGGDNPLAGIVMQLTGTDSLGNAVSRFAGTNATGQYSFTGLLPGTYTVTENQPTGYTSVANTPGAVTGGTAGATGPLGGTQETQAITITAATGSALNVDFGERLTSGSMRGFKSVFNQSRPGQQASSGDVLVWTITYKNESGGNLPLQLNDVLPTGLTRTGAPAITLASTGVVAGLALNPAYTGAGVNDLLLAGGTFGAGAVVTITLPTVVLPSASGTLSNQARNTAVGIPVVTSQIDNTTPTLPAGVTVPANSTPQPSPTNANPNNVVPTVVTVGNVPAAVSGSVWIDQNSDRRRDSGDTPVPNWGVAVYNAAGTLIPCTTNTSTAGCVTMPDGRSLFKTDANGNYGVTGLQPGAYKIEFRDAANNIIFGTPMNSGGDPNSRVSPNRDSLNITLVSGQNMVQQDLPLDPSGVVYDSTTRQPIPGARVEMCGPAGFNPATMLIGGAYTVSGTCAAMIVGPTGMYQYLLTPGAPAGTYSLNVTAPGYAPAPSGLIAPSPGPLNPAGPSPLLVQAQAGPPTGAQPTTYYMSFNLSPGVPDIIHNHIPLDPFSGGGLFLQKLVDRTTVELGDSLMYTLRLTSPVANVTNARIRDTLPAGFRLIPGTVIQDNVRVPDPSGAPGPSLDFAVGNVAVNQIITITYRVRVGVGAQQGDGVNRARATAQNGGATVSSNEAQARVKITSGVFFQEACFAGKIYVDCNNNRIQDPEELGIPGVRFYLHDGTYLISDTEGKYSYCGLPARTAVIKADSTTLPIGSQLVTSSNRNALDANSLFMDLQIGELHRADFIEGSCGPGVLEQVKARRTKGQVVAPQVEKKPQPKLIFESGGSIRKEVPKERDDVMRSCPAGQCAPAQGAAATPVSGGQKGGAK